MISKKLKLAQHKLSEISDAPMLDAEWLMLHVLGRDENSWLQTHGEYELSNEEEEKYEKLVEERKTGKPLAYILGYWEFYGRRFLVNEDVLVPRPATEDLVDEALRVIAARQLGHQPLTVADVGTGSGCVAITLILEARIKQQELSMMATDISPVALAVAKQNAARQRVADRIEFIQGDMLEALRGKKVDLIVSNPPYIPTKEVLPFEPAQALDGGEDGMKFIEQIKNSGIPAVVEGVGGKISFWG